MSFINQATHSVKSFVRMTESWEVKRAYFIQKLSEGRSLQHSVSDIVDSATHERFLTVFARELQSIQEVSEEELVKEEVAQILVDSLVEELDRELGRWEPLSSTSLIQVEMNNEYFALLKNVRRMF